MTLKEWTHSHTRTLIAAVLVVGFLVFLYVHESKNKGQELAELKTYIAEQETQREKNAAADKAELAKAKQQIDDLEKKKQQVIVQPAAAPQIIREYLPTATPIQQTAAITKDTLPDAPVAVLTRQQEQDIAVFATTCRQCTTERDALKDSLARKEQDLQGMTKERDKAVDTAKGGSIWQRVRKVLVVSGCAGLGAGAGSQVKKPGSAAIGAAAGAVVCTLVQK